MTSAQTETTFPLDWNEWRAEWAEWKNAHDLKRPRENPWRYKDKNFLADAILGVYRVNGRTVELSEVTMPNFGARPREDFRYVGLTFDNGETGLAHSFTELETALGLARVTS